MGILKKKSPWEREFQRTWQQEQKFLQKYAQRKENILEKKLDTFTPGPLLDTIHGGFVKAFELVFERGDRALAKVGNQSAREETYRVNQFKADLREDRKSLRAFAKEADRAGLGSVLLSGAAGVGMGLFGVALPDVPLFTAMLLKCVYETGESFGFSHDTEEERLYVLRLIEAALSYGDELRDRGKVLDAYGQTEVWPAGAGLDDQLQATARQLSETVLFGKMLQNVPVAGAVGGAEDALILGRVRKYAAIKYRKRFLIRRKLTGK